MSIWRTNPVDDDPVIVLRSWSVFAVPTLSDGEVDHHFNGYNIYNQEGRVSSKIIEFDSKTKIGKTRSGRKYLLEDGPGYNSDSFYVFGRWLRVNNVDEKDVEDVTGEYLTKEDLKKYGIKVPNKGCK